MAFELYVCERDSGKVIQSLGVFATYQKVYTALDDNVGHGQLIGGHRTDMFLDDLYYRVKEFMDVTKLKLEVYHNDSVKVYMQYVHIA